MPTTTAAEQTRASQSRAYLTVAEVAAYLREHPETIRQRIRAGQIPAVRTGGSRGPFKVHPTDLANYVRSLAAGSERAEPTRSVA